jgi:enoyl-CoA hydratase/carnithine racemase
MFINYEKDDKIAVFTINRPEAMNAMSMQVSNELRTRMIEFRDDPEVWVGIITGAGGKAFCAGADIKEMQPGNQANLRSLAGTPMRGLSIWKPLIAAINGLAIGAGFKIALTCDIRIASENARFSLPEVNVGLIPGMEGSQILPRMIPWCKAAEILLMGRPIDAQEAYRIGLINKVVPPEQVLTTAREWAYMICQAAPLAVRATKEAMIRGCYMDQNEGLQLETELSDYLSNTEDFAEGTKALVEKRKALFKAR